MTTLNLPSCDDSLIRQIWLSAYQRPILSVADELDLFSFLEKMPASVEEVAAQFSLNPRGAEAMLATLASLGFLSWCQGKFHLTEVSHHFLIPSKPFYWGHMLRMFQKIPLSHELLMESIQRGEPTKFSEDKAIIEEWESADIPPERATVITRAMHSHSLAAAIGLAQRIDLSGVRSLLDVGGGSGCFCITMAQRYPQMRFTVADLPSVCEMTRQYVAEYGLHNHINVVVLDMFRDSWPSGYDAIFLANILHDWDKARRDYLIQQSFKTLPAKGRIFLYEMLLSDQQDGPLTAALFSVAMTHVTLGKQFTAAELDALLREHGFEEVSIKPMYAGYSLVSGQKPG